MEQTLKMENITKIFPGVIANDKVTLEAYKGEILAIVGENGAGKSTLMSILYGHYQPEEGQIYINGNKENITSTKRAIDLGIGMVFQHFMLVPTLSVYENIILGLEPMKNNLIDSKKAIKDCQEIVNKHGLNIDVRQKVGDLTIGIQQKVEIIKALYRKAKILILDEPTAVLTPNETVELFKTMREFANEGKTIIFITHKLNEVMELADRITVIRKGKTVGTVNKSETSQQKLAEMMVGRSVVLRVSKSEAVIGKKSVVVSNISAEGMRKASSLKNISFDIFEGEIFGIAGIEGNGQTELLEVLTGLRKIKDGNITINDKKIANLSPRKIRENKIIHIPEDRHKRGLILKFTVKENLIAGIHYKKKFIKKWGLLDDAAIDKNADILIEKYDIRGGGKLVEAGQLSGGNQQKIIIAREFEQEHDFLIASQPTRGVDVGAIEFIHKKLIQTRDEKKAVLLISADLNEILSLSDRIGVLYEGNLVGILDASEATETRLGLMMAGVDYKISEDSEVL